MTKPKILVVDDEKPTRDVLARVLGATYECLTAPDAEAAMALVRTNRDLALLLTDYKMPGADGIELIRRAKAENPTLAAVLVTAFGEIDLAVEAMKEGADDFLTKPITDLGQLEVRLAKAIRNGALARRVADLESKLADKAGLGRFTGASEAMERVYRLVRQAAPSNATVLVTGPSGTGKELVAHALHDLSPRASGPFVPVVCSALSASLLESELFGYEAGGAFTGANAKGRVGNIEAADGGTLFLDEIGEIDLPTQVKLLRTLESKTIRRVGGNVDVPVDFRLVCATNRNLAERVASGEFREDLYYRLNVIEISLPPLRERPGDVALLVSRFLRDFSDANGGRVTGIEPDALRALEGYDWPGNVRQLRNVIERMVVLASGDRLTRADLPENIVRSQAPAAPVAAPTPPETAAPAPTPPAAPAPTPAALPAPSASLAESERRQILAELEACRGNKTRAAERLGISRRTLHRKLKEWNL